jgi:hypothetical protein
MKGTVLRHLVVVVLAALLASCARDSGPPSDPLDVVELRWVKAYPRESRSDVNTGLVWGLSLVGVNIRGGAEVIRWRGDRITLDLGRAELVDGTRPAWRQLIAAIKASGEYQAHGALDVGRFIVLTLGNTKHYYALTGARRSYQEARGRYRFEDKAAALVISGVALGNRRVDVSRAERVDQIAFVAYEGKGAFADGTFVPHEMELVDVMPNGQLRFALYDLDGQLKPGATPELTVAGKPAKCMWCHEAHIKPSYTEFADVNGYLPRRQFDDMIYRRAAILQEYRDDLDTRVDFRDKRDHTYPELLYLAFEEPSRERLAREWGVSVERAGEVLRGLPTHAHEEFKFLGDELYDRNAVDALAPYPVLAVPLSVREVEGEEPALIEVH